MSRGKRRGHGVRHVFLALLLVSPPCVRLAADFLRGLSGADAGSEEDAASLRVDLEAAREELRIAKLDLEARDLGHSLPGYRIVLAEPLPVEDPSARRGTLWASARGAMAVPAGTAALSGQALVGRVARTFSPLRILRIQTLRDPAFRVRFRSGETSGMLWGSIRSASEHPILEIRHLSEGAELVPGDPVYTEGGDGVYPEGILIGFLAGDDGAPPSRASPLPAGPVSASGLVVRAAAGPAEIRRLALAVDLRKLRLEEARGMDAAAAVVPTRREGAPH